MAKKEKRMALEAKKVAKDPTLVEAEPGFHALLHDTSTVASFENMLTALDLLVPRGWRIVGMSTNLGTSQMNIDMFVLLQRPPTSGDTEGVTWPYEP